MNSKVHISKAILWREVKCMGAIIYNDCMVVSGISRAIDIDIKEVGPRKRGADRSCVPWRPEKEHDACLDPDR